MGDREHDVEVLDRQNLLLTVRGPLGSCRLLALRAVAVPAGVVGDTLMVVGSLGVGDAFVVAVVASVVVAVVVVVVVGAVVGVGVLVVTAVGGVCCDGCASNVRCCEYRRLLRILLLSLSFVAIVVVVVSVACRCCVALFWLMSLSL